MSTHTSTNIPMHGPGAILTASLVLAGCGSDLTETAPICDDIGWPLGISPVISPPLPEFGVECADGWGNAVETRAVLDTVALPEYPGWTSLPHPVDGWIQVVMPEYLPDWKPWLEAHGIELASIPEVHVLLWIRQDGSLGWVAPDFGIWAVDLVDDELWALGWDSDDYDSKSLLIFDPASGELLDSRPWDLGPRYNRFEAARDPAGGAWITAIEDREADDLVDQSLYRATTIDAVELVATRTTEGPRQAPSGGIVTLPDGAAAWWTADGFEVVELDGSVRWTHPDGMGSVSDVDSMLITSLVPTGVGAGSALRLEKVAVADGSLLWTREHRRYEVVEPEHCGSDGCGLIDFAYPILRPDGGYLLIGRHAYPSSTCIGQPLIMAVSADGDAEWAHRVETCGYASRAAFRDESKLELLGITWTHDGSFPAGAWTRWFEL
jgi:hypothetical protein